MNSPLLARLIFPALLLSTPSWAAAAEPQWVWTSKQPKEGERAVFRHTFTLNGAVKSATLTLSCDNGAKAMLNGKAAAESTDWKSPARADVAKLLKSGENELRIEGRNEDGVAALVATLNIETTDGKKLSVVTGPEWQGAAPGSSEFKPVVVIAPHGAAPWGEVLSKTANSSGKSAPGKAADPASLQVAEGFKVELIYTVPKAEQGSWVSMTEDDRGRLILCDQYGKLFRVTVPPMGASDGARVEALPAEISGAHGLLHAFGSLYVMVNETTIVSNGKKQDTGRSPGIWRLKQRARDDQFEAPELLYKFDGNGEHGPHSLVLAPDGKSIYFANGNHTKPPTAPQVARPLAIGEDHLITRLWDANGHAKGILAPGGYVGKIDPDGKRVELFSGGFRNQYDIAFDANGELFTFDSDMEWDLGTPWYMPTRINHIVSGGDYGWRSGAGRWPSYYADSLPATIDIGPGSPTGTVFGTGAKFPAKYQRALFALDWTYATIWAVHLTADGASFKAEKEDFVAGKAFSVADAIIRRADGAMYIAVGGRNNQSSLYRVSYTGKESTAPAAPVAATPASKLRRELESLHSAQAGPAAIAKIWPHLASPDRFIRFAARVALEHQPTDRWSAQALQEKNPQAAIEALIALARVGDKALQKQLITALGQIDYAKQPAELRLALLRAWQLTFTRMGKPAPALGAEVLAKLNPLFPQTDPHANRELISLLVYLGSTEIVAKAVPLLDTAKEDNLALASQVVLARNEGYARAVAGTHESRPNRQAIAYAYALREAQTGWTPALRKAFFAWFPRTQQWRGGNSFAKFIDNIRKDALSNCVSETTERAALDELSRKAPPAPPANLVAPKGPGKAYSVEEVLALAQGGFKGRNFEQGKAMFASTLCVNCHHFNGQGGNVGPDLTGSANRYSLHDLMENIIEPSKVISDQYGTEEITNLDGSLAIGRVVVEENGKLFLMASALAPDALTTLNSADIKSRKPFNVSMMPPGLINSLNKDELLDLLAYILSGGNPQDKAFTK